MSDLALQIRSRGHWEVTIRPGNFQPTRVKFADLDDLLARTVVKMRGWDFPHIDDKTPIDRNIDWIGQDFAWDIHLESWRFFQSGQFFHLSGFVPDWRDKSTWWPADSDWVPQTQLGIGDTVYRFEEIMELACRLALTDVGDQMMHIEAVAKGLAGRSLFVDTSHRWPLSREYKATLSEFPQTIDVDRDELLADPRRIVLEWSSELFRRFGWDPGHDVLSSWLHKP